MIRATLETDRHCTQTSYEYIKQPLTPSIHNYRNIITPNMAFEAEVFVYRQAKSSQSTRPTKLYNLSFDQIPAWTCDLECIEELSKRADTLNSKSEYHVNVKARGEDGVKSSLQSNSSKVSSLLIEQFPTSTAGRPMMWSFLEVQDSRQVVDQLQLVGGKLDKLDKLDTLNASVESLTAEVRLNNQLMTKLMKALCEKEDGAVLL